MRSLLLITAVSSVQVVAAAQRMNVAICSTDRLGASDLSMAKTETELVYRAAGVEIVWYGCDAFPASPSRARAPWFLVRLWNHKAAVSAGSGCPDVMGQAFVEEGAGTTADAYIPAIWATADEQHADRGVLLGFVVAHELGHLLLGPRHASLGLMQPVWGRPQIDALRQRHLRFTRAGAQRIRLALHARTPQRIHWWSTE